jgi:hypothetical protein
LEDGLKKKEKKKAQPSKSPLKSLDSTPCLA